MYKVCGFQLGIFEILFPVNSLENARVCGFYEKYLRLYNCCATNFTAAANYTNPETGKLFKLLDEYYNYFN